MRVALLLLLAVPAWASPYVRWLDATGGEREAAIAAVLHEDAVEIRLKGEDGKALTIPTARLILLVREDESDTDQRALLLARLGALHGEAGAAAAPLFDRLAARAKPEWMRHYAAAARVLWSFAAGEKGAGERAAKFREAHPRSRFAGAIQLATLRAAGLAVSGPVERGQLMFKAFGELEASGAPIVVQYGAMPIAAELLLDTGMDRIEFNQFADSLSASIAEVSRDAVHLTVFEEARARVTVAQIRHTRRGIEKAGEKPFGSAERLRKLEAKHRFLRRELRCDLLYELGVARLACGQPDLARKAFDEAFKLAPDPWRRARAEKRRTPR
ncbi:MAG: hypothetical protein ACYTGN_17190 [Planctomycetota bacterium]|jgi:hypothetical protein